MSLEGETLPLHQGLFFELEDTVTQHLCPVFITGRLVQSSSCLSCGSPRPVLEFFMTLLGMDPPLPLFSLLVPIRKMSVWLCFHRHTHLEMMGFMLCRVLFFPTSLFP